MGWIAPTPGALAVLRARRSLLPPPRPTPPPGPAPAPLTPGLARPSFGTAVPPPAFLYYPHSERAVTNAAEVRSVPGEGGAPPLAATGTGPDQLTDALGRRFWRFEGTDWLELPRSFVSSPRALTVLMVGRVHQNRTTNLFGHLYREDGSTIANTLGAFLNTYSSGGRIGALRTSNLTTAGLTGREWMVPGAQLALIGVAGRDAAGTRFYCGRRVASGARSPSAMTGLQGARIGGYAQGNGTSNGFDLYAVAGWTGELTDAQADAAAARLNDHFALAAIERQLLVEGDSITDGVGEVPSGANLAMALTDPGRPGLPAGVRVLNLGTSGNKVSHLVTKRDAADGWPLARLPGGSAANRLAVQIGRNDTAQGATPEQVHDAIAGYLGEAGTGVLARGFDATVAINIANGSMSAIGPLRDLLRAAGFSALAGGPDAGRVTRLDLPLIEAGGARPFDTAEATAGPAYQAGDSTHPNVAGTRLMATGGDTPRHGYGALMA